VLEKLRRPAITEFQADFIGRLVTEPLAPAIRAGLEAGSRVGVVMSTQLTAQLAADGLMAEVRRYLIAVEAFRGEGREPHWLPEREVGPWLAASSSLVLSTDRRRYT
jgi:hypothetical protein